MIQEAKIFYNRVLILMLSLYMWNIYIYILWSLSVEGSLLED